MFKNIAILFCVILCSTEIFGTLEIIRQFLETNDWNVTRVRTPEERERRRDEFAVLDFIGLVEQYEGYTAEEYDVQTHDGYILKLHRISGSPYSPKAPGKPAILFQHGLLVSADFQVMLGPKQALTFQLADAGYDVWLGNVRGNTYSKRHIKYTSETSNYDFWKFSLDEMATIDLPTFIDAVLEKTGQEKITYIGYSMGTTLLFMLLSEKSEYNNKMNLVISITPAVYFSSPYAPPIKMMLTIEPQIKEFAIAKRFYGIFPQSKIIQILGKDICSSELGEIICGNSFSSWVNVKNLNFTALPMIFSHIPAGTSLYAVDHYFQMMFSEKFQKYNFGVLGNKLRYRSITPPEYDVSKVTAPQAIFYSENDVFVSVRDVMKLKNTLKNVVAFEKPSTGNFNHLDYGFAYNARDVVYNRILQVIEENT